MKLKKGGVLPPMLKNKGANPFALTLPCITFHVDRIPAVNSLHQPWRVCLLNYQLLNTNGTDFTEQDTNAVKSKRLILYIFQQSIKFLRGNFWLCLAVDLLISFVVERDIAQGD